MIVGHGVQPMQEMPVSTGESMQARSAAAMVKGYQEFDPDLNVAGVIFNKIGGAAHKEWLVEAVAATGVQTTVFGGMPKVSMLHSNAVK